MFKSNVSPADVLALKNSDTFDAEWYSSEHPDVAKSGLDPAEHFLWLGQKLGRSPLPPPAMTLPRAGGRTEPTHSAIADSNPNLMTLAKRGMPRPPLDLEVEKANHFDITDDQFWSVVPQVYDFTELSIGALFNLYSAVRYIVEAGIPGDLVECGVHMGGSIMLIEHVLLHDTAPRRLFALDTFTGFVRRSEELDLDLRTGAAACPLEESGLDYTSASTANMESVGYEGLCVVKGDVLETIPTLDVEQLALLRLDTDTYDTTKFELEQLYDRVVPGGVVIVDDYGYTVGCKKAVDEFLVGRQVLLQRINPNVRSWVKAA